MTKGGIVLCGGLSSRMGQPKASLPFGPELLLPRVVRLLSQSVDSIVVVAAPQQEVPEMKNVTVVRDDREGRGPLEGLAAGLTELHERVDAVYATACDVPSLVPAFVDRMFALLGNHAIAVPREGKYFHPLAAVYRVEVLEQVRILLDRDRLRPFFLFEQVTTREIAPEEWHEADPNSSSLENLNTPEDYQAALAAAGYSAFPNE